MSPFQVGGNVHENVKALRESMGSAKRMLSAADLAEIVSAKHPTRSVSASTVQRWEVDVEPDLHSAAIMADLAGVSFETFAIGDPAKRAKPKRSAKLSEGGIPVGKPDDEKNRRRA